MTQMDLANPIFGMPSSEYYKAFRDYPALYRLLAKGTHSKPAQRFHSAEQLSDQLAGVLRQIVGGTLGVPVSSNLFVPGIMTTTGKLGFRGEAVLDEGDKAIDHLRFGDQALRGGNYVSAESFYKQAAKINPNSVDAHLRLAEVYIDTSEFGMALAEVTKVQRMAPGNWKVAWYTGRLLEAQEKYAAAADYIATAPLTQIEAYSVVTASGSKNVGPRRVHDCDQLNIDAEIILANQQLFNAAHNVTYPGERTAVERITAGMEEYVGHLTVMQHEFDQASNTANAQDSHLRNAYQAYLAASSVLHTRIQRQPSIVEDRSTLPACHIGIDQHLAQPNTWVNGGIADNIDCLSDINYTHLQGTTSTGGGYNDVISFLNTALIGAILLSIIFVGWLLISTWRMAAVTHRVINVGLSLSLLVGLIFSLMIIGTLLNFTGLPGTHTASQDGAYRQLVKDDYDSVYYAAKLKRYGTDANADESRWLIALTFNDTTTASGADHWAADWGTNIQQVQQLIANAQNNQTWNEEIQPLSDIHSSWNKYITIDRQIRAAANNGSDPQHIHNAEVISTGPSNAAFGTFSDAVTALSKANYDHYNITLSSTQNTLNIYTSLSAILYPLIGLCAAWGIYTRLNEF
ncbi:tetratricopeptide repeat protein [Ktedonobacter racemifer]|uniref:Uncharacterized protein n=1 Tax=Ktedonobacter racemifer DSM 44963 TaxID=485913 RepID=D6TRZ1_KTERA|nr:tetratricopeptide repeat protein [Ktedonobacter racemifer]EFH86064.1 hypothetical protein Krac_7331 [Ktedonobacter racemifer DSM 44963]